MKIDFIISDLNSGGAQRVMVLLANHFATKNYQIKLITLNPGKAFDLHDNVELQELHHGWIKNHTLRSTLNLLKYYAARKNRPDLIISFLTQLSLKAIIAAKFYGIRVIASEHNSYLRAQKPIFLTQFTRNFLYPRADYLTVLTSFDIPYYKKKGVNVVVMPNPCSFQPRETIVEKKQKVILAVGFLNRYHHKGFDNLIRIIGPLLKDHADWHLKIIGGGDSGLKYLTKLAQEHGILNKITFTGYRKDVREIMSESEIFILSSRFEGLPMVLLEAMSQGMACIAYDCKTGPRELISNNHNGLLIPDQDEVAMQQGLERLIEDARLRKELSLNAIKSLENFSIENITNQWEALFLEMKLPVPDQLNLKNT